MPLYPFLPQQSPAGVDGEEAELRRRRAEQVQSEKRDSSETRLRFHIYYGPYTFLSCRANAQSDFCSIQQSIPLVIGDLQLQLITNSSLQTGKINFTRVGQKVRLSGPMPSLLNQNLHISKSSRRFVGTLHHKRYFVVSTSLIKLFRV